MASSDEVPVPANIAYVLPYGSEQKTPNRDRRRNGSHFGAPSTSPQEEAVSQGEDTAVIVDTEHKVYPLPHTLDGIAAYQAAASRVRTPPARKFVQPDHVSTYKEEPGATTPGSVRHAYEEHEEPPPPNHRLNVAT